MKTIRVILILVTGLQIWSGCQQNPYPQGEWLYQNRCANCHMEDGSGLGAQIPALSSSALLSGDHAAAICLIYNGRVAAQTKAGQLEMPGNKDLTPAELANLVNYINSQWHPDVQALKSSDIERWMNECSN